MTKLRKLPDLGKSAEPTGNKITLKQDLIKVEIMALNLNPYQLMCWCLRLSSFSLARL